MNKPAGERLDLSFLNKDEVTRILQVLERDEKLRRTEQERVSKLQRQATDVRWLRAASGEWFREIQKKKFRNERDVTSLVKCPLTCRLKETKPQVESEKSKMSRLENVQPPKNINAGPSFLGIRSSFSSLFSFGKSKQNVKTPTQRNDLFSYNKQTCNEEKKKVYPFQSSGSVKKNINFFESFTKKTKENKVPPTNAEIEKEAFQVLGDLDQTLCEEQSQPANTIRSSPNHSHGIGGSLHSTAHPRKEYISYMQVKPWTVPHSEGCKTHSIYQPKRFDEMYLNKLHPGIRQQFSYKNKSQKTPSLSSASENKTTISVPSTGTFSSRSLHFPFFRKNGTELETNKVPKSKRTPISSINWHDASSSNKETNHRLFRTQSDLALPTLSRSPDADHVYEFYRSGTDKNPRESWRNTNETDKINNKNSAKSEIFHDSEDPSNGISKIHSSLLRTHSAMDMTSLNDSNSKKQKYAVYVYKNHDRKAEVNNNNAYSGRLTVFQDITQQIYTGIHKTNSSVLVPGTNIQEQNTIIQGEENKENASNRCNKHMDVEPMETENEGSVNYNTIKEEQDLADNAKFVLESNHVDPIDFDTNSLTLPNKGYNILPDGRDNGTQESFLNENDCSEFQSISYIINNFQEDKRLKSPIADQLECDTNDGVVKECTLDSEETIPLPYNELSIVDKDASGAEPFPCLPCDVSDTVVEQCEDNLNRETECTDSVWNKTISPEYPEILDNPANTEFRQGRKTKDDNIKIFHSDLLVYQSRPFSSLPDLNPSTNYTEVKDILFTSALTSAFTSAQMNEPLQNTSISVGTAQSGAAVNIASQSSLNLVDCFLNTTNETAAEATPPSDISVELKEMPKDNQTDATGTVPQNSSTQPKCDYSGEKMVTERDRKIADKNNNRQSQASNKQCEEVLKLGDVTDSYLLEAENNINKNDVTVYFQDFTDKEDKFQVKENYQISINLNKAKPFSDLSLCFQPNIPLATEHLERQDFKPKSNINENLINKVYDKYPFSDDSFGLNQREASEMSKFPISRYLGKFENDAAIKSFNPFIPQNINLANKQLVSVPDPCDLKPSTREEMESNLTLTQNQKTNSLTFCETDYQVSETQRSYCLTKRTEYTEMYENVNYVVSDYETIEYHERISVCKTVPRNLIGGKSNMVQTLESGEPPNDHLTNIQTEFHGGSDSKQRITETSSHYNMKRTSPKKENAFFPDDLSYYGIMGKNSHLYPNQVKKETNYPGLYNQHSRVNKNNFSTFKSPGKRKWDVYYTLPSRKAHCSEFGRTVAKDVDLPDDGHHICSPNQTLHQTYPDHSLPSDFQNENLNNSYTDNINNLYNRDNLVYNTKNTRIMGDNLPSLCQSRNVDFHLQRSPNIKNNLRSPIIEPLGHNQEILDQRKPNYSPPHAHSKMQSHGDKKRFTFSFDNNEQGKMSSLPCTGQFESSSSVPDVTDYPYLFYSMNEPHQDPLDKQVQDWDNLTGNNNSNLYRSRSLKFLNNEEEHDLMQRSKKNNRDYSSKSTGGILSRKSPSGFQTVDETKHERSLSCDLLTDENDNCKNPETGSTNRRVYTSKSLDYGIFGKEQQMAFLNTVKKALTEGRLWRPCFLKNPGFLRSEGRNYSSSQSASYSSDGNASQTPSPTGFLNIYEDEVIICSDAETDTTTDDEYYLEAIDKETEL
ncbi:hypothetical protein GDO86_004659 [Hymenochirus boettgeri]|uniref:RabBD domain-containing protein n=1 Tax=Hymenochirus boettgeri TaxID=247094 RepID=A0A8T2K6V4_9PIPI|nr:hypothetical protein GDO86_004659 [Hymenochirus boettgeri]